MSNMHILESSGGLIRIARHVTIPGGNNSAGVAWATAVINSGSGGTTVLRDGDGTAGTIAAAEKTSIQAGSVVELVGDFYLPSGLSGAQILALLDADYTTNSASLLALLQARLQQYGRVR